jgi:hypothetical protein
MPSPVGHTCTASTIQQIQYAVSVALGWIEDATGAFADTRGELPTLPATTQR